MPPQKNAEGIWYQRVRTPPNKHGVRRRIYVSCPPDFNSASKCSQMVREAVERHMSGMFTKNDTFASYVGERFMKEYPAAKNLQPTTKALLTYMLEDIASPVLGPIPLAAIDAPRMARFVADLQSRMKVTKGSKSGGTGKKAKRDRPPPGVEMRVFSDRTIRHIVVAVISVLRWAVKVKDLAVLPDIDIPKVANSKKPEPYSLEEARKLFEAARDDEERLLFLLMFEAGLRASEILGLTFSKINYAKHELLIDQQSYRGQALRHTKSGRERRVPMSRSLEKRLLKRAGIGTTFVFADDEGGPRTHWWLRHIFNRARRAAGLRPTRVHDGRHFFASQGNFDLFELQKLLGHANIQTTQEYAHPLMPQPPSLLDTHEVDQHTTRSKTDSTPQKAGHQ